MTNDQSTHRNGLLFLCAGSSARSQMAEAFARYIGPVDFRYYSAVVTAIPGLHPHAVKVMREAGIDLPPGPPRTLTEIPLHQIATVVSLCAADECPPLPAGIHHLSWPLTDPAAPEDGDDSMQAFRRVRDEIRELVSRLF